MGRKDQSQRFKDTARRLGVDEGGEAFERALRKIMPPKDLRKQVKRRKPIKEY